MLRSLCAVLAGAAVATAAAAATDSGGPLSLFQEKQGWAAYVQEEAAWPEDGQNTLIQPGSEDMGRFVSSMEEAMDQVSSRL